ncbi:hypothetical protein QJQ45_022583 [Haematococcus lacustris]|nr:hypothetical protein QJQ45_022583 [Haematococcus lacustris]
MSGALTCLSRAQHQQLLTCRTKKEFRDMLCFLYGDALLSEIDTDARSQLVQSASNQQQVQQVQQRLANLSTVPQQNVAAHGAQAAEQPNVAALGAPLIQQPSNAALGAGQQNGAANVPLFSFTPVSGVQTMQTGMQSDTAPANANIPSPLSTAVPTAPGAPQPQPQAQLQPQPPVQQLAQEVAAAATVVAAAGPGEAKTAAINAFTSSAQQLLTAAGRLHAVEPVSRAESAALHEEPTQVARSNVRVTLPVIKKWSSKDLLEGRDFDMFVTDVRRYASASNQELTETLLLHTTDDLRKVVGVKVSQAHSQGKAMTADEVIVYMKELIGYHLHDTKHIAMNRLVQGHVKQQPGQSVLEYAVGFRLEALKAAEVPQPILCDMFVRGLTPDLRQKACQCRMMGATSRMWMAAGVKWVVSLRSSVMSQRLSPPTLQPTLQPTLPAQLCHSMSQRRTMQGVPGVRANIGTIRTQHLRPWGVAGGVVASLQDQRQAGGCHRAEAGAVDTRVRLPGSQLRPGLWQQPLSISQSFARAVAIHSQSASALTRLVTRILPGLVMDVSYQRPRRYTLREMNEMKKQVAELLAKKLIEPSCSPYGAPVLFVEKRDGTLRMCVDYRALNKLTVRDRYPLPRIDDLFDKLQGKTIFSSLDLQSGYHQIRITPEDVPKTAFVTPEGQFQYKVLSFGLTNAPATFQRVMNRVFEKQLKEGLVLVYLDDILVMSSSPEEHAMHLKEVLQVMKDNQLYAKLSKCDFNRPELKFLGHIVGRQGIAVDPAKVQVIKEWPVPTSLKELQAFLGLANFFRQFIHSRRLRPEVDYIIFSREAYCR